MIVLAGDAQGEVKHGGIVEILVGETLTVAGPMSYVDGAGAGGVVVNGRAITIASPGRRRFRTADGMFDLNVLAVDPAVLQTLPHGQRTGHGSCDRRMILRSLANHCPKFDGTVASLPDSFAAYGGTG
jgi:hypothetical protein